MSKQEHETLEIKNYLTLYTPEYSAKICGIDPEDIIYSQRIC